MSDLSEYQRRVRELAALYETAGDLSGMRDVDQVLGAIVHRGRQLLGTDVAYLMLLDEDRREAYMRVAAGTVTPEFLSIRLAYGEGLGGLVAKTGAPQWTGDYYADPRFAPSIDSIVRGESLQSLLGVPLRIGDRVTGVLFASDRRGREFTTDEVALLSSLASHAAIALENASLFQESQRALEKWKTASRSIEDYNRSLERAAELHERLTGLVLTGASVRDLADAVSAAIGGRVLVLGPDRAPLTAQPDPLELPGPEVFDEVAAAGHGSLETAGPPGSTLRIAVAQAGTRRLGYLVHVGAPLADTDVRSLERAALVTALLLLDLTAHDEARSRVMGELFAELTADPDADEQRVRRRAEASGVALPEPPYVALAGLDAGDHDGSGRLGPAATRLAMADGGLARVQGDRVALLLPGADAGEVAQRAAQRLGDAVGAPVTVGGVGPCASLVEAAGAVPRALACARVLVSTGQVGRGATPEQLGLYTLLFGGAGRDEIEGFVAATIGPVQEYDAARGGSLVHTIETYFDVGGQTGKLAEALYVHVNTLYQRLERVDRLLGDGWRRGEQSLQVHLAVRLARLLQHDM